MLNNAHINQSTDLSNLPSNKKENRGFPSVYEELPNHLPSYGLKTPGGLKALKRVVTSSWFLEESWSRV